VLQIMCANQIRAATCARAETSEYLILWAMSHDSNTLESKLRSRKAQCSGLEVHGFYSMARKLDMHCEFGIWASSHKSCAVRETRRNAPGYHCQVAIDRRHKVASDGNDVSVKRS
jgi:hypothetical protein